MRILRPRARVLLLAALATLLALCLGSLAVKPRLESGIRERIRAEAARRGMVARIDSVRMGLWPPLRLTGVALEIRKGWRLTAEAVDVSWWGRTKVLVKKALLQAPAGLTLAAESTTWDIDSVGGADFRAALRQPGVALVLSRAVASPGEQTWVVQAENLPLGRRFDLRRFGRPLLESGAIRGRLTLKTSATGARFDLDLAARSTRLPALAGEGSSGAGLGEPTDAAANVVGLWKRREGALEIPRWSASIGGAALGGSVDLRDLNTDPILDLSLQVDEVDFARLLRTWGLEAPENLASPTSAGNPTDLGSATLAARARGRISEPASFVVTQKLDFRPPRRIPPAIERLRGDFVHEVVKDSEARRILEVSASSPDFIPLAEVPPLFVRALLIAEDAGFYGHPGVDLREVPAALLTDWARGGAARGASTITQQLAKNLFLSRRKQVGRKLQELSLTLLLESALKKSRILEIYLNVIEWGPDIYGLRPAARAYFGREPAELTPAQMAFLVSLIPGPVKYQSSFADGTPGPGLRRLVDALLAKLRSVEALNEEEYQAALGEEIVVQGRSGPPAPPDPRP